jgi:TPR repeat protein
MGNRLVEGRFSRSRAWRVAIAGAAAACFVMGTGVQLFPVHDGNSRSFGTAQAETTAPESVDDPLVRECHGLSADPADASRPAGVRGVYFAALDAASAVTACRAALARFPDSVRIRSELGRALVKGRAYDETFTVLKRAAEDSYAQAEADIGELYEDGLGVRQDYAQAMVWYRKAADQNNPDGQNDIGALDEHGHGVNQDYAQSMAWRRKAADQGYAAALNDIGWLYERGSGVVQDYAQAMAWYQKRT